MVPLGGFLNPSDRILRRDISFHNKTTSCIDYADYHNPLLFCFPETTRCVGSTDGWIAIDSVDAENMHTYYLHNEFSSTTLSLPELDAAIGHVSELFQIRKVLLRSTPDDVIALMTNHPRCPIILARLGKGVWLPKSYAASYACIIDVAFLGDRLYGITLAEDLVFLDISYDDKGVPMAIDGECVIGDAWRNEEDYDDEEEDNDDYDDEEYDGVDVASDGGDRDTDIDHDSSNCEDEYDNSDDEDYDETQDDDQHTYDLTKLTKADILEAIEETDVDESPREIKPSIYNVFRRKPTINTMRYLIESCGKLLMVRRQELSPYNGKIPFTHKVEVFEADISAAKWVPVEGGLGGQTLFISRPFCKSISASCSKEIQEDAIYFIDTDDVFDMRSKSVSAPRDDWDYTMNLRNCDTDELTWVFPPELLA
jgi:hypothetical protein